MSASYPFRYNSELEDIVNKLVSDNPSQESAFNSVYQWVSDNIAYDYDLCAKLEQYPSTRERLQHGIVLKDSLEVFQSRIGICFEQTLLAVAMARLAGVKAFNVLISTDVAGVDVNHECAGAQINGRLILADTTYKVFDIQHKKYDILTGDRVVRRFRKLNGLYKAAAEAEKSYDYIPKSVEQKPVKPNETEPQEYAAPNTFARNIGIPNPIGASGGVFATNQNSKPYESLLRNIAIPVIAKQTNIREDSILKQEKFDFELFFAELLAQLGGCLKNMFTPIIVTALFGLPSASYGINYLIQKIKAGDNARIEYILRK